LNRRRSGEFQGNSPKNVNGLSLYIELKGAFVSYDLLCI